MPTVTLSSGKSFEVSPGSLRTVRDFFTTMRESKGDPEKSFDASLKLVAASTGKTPETLQDEVNFIEYKELKDAVMAANGLADKPAGEAPAATESTSGQSTAA